MSSFEARWTSAVAWRKSSLCASGECVEVAQRDSAIAVRNSTRPDGSVLLWEADAWRSFVNRIKAGELDFQGDV
jgi:uncharacterized protein DUF397